MGILSGFHKLARAVYRANRATRTAEVIASGNPKRMKRLVIRRLGFKVANRIINKLSR